MKLELCSYSGEEEEAYHDFIEDFGIHAIKFRKVLLFDLLGLEEEIADLLLSPCQRLLLVDNSGSQLLLEDSLVVDRVFKSSPSYESVYLD
jgi:hypothetical protein